MRTFFILGGDALPWWAGDRDQRNPLARVKAATAKDALAKYLKSHPQAQVSDLSALADVEWANIGTYDDPHGPICAECIAMGGGNFDDEIKLPRAKWKPCNHCLQIGYDQARKEL